MTIGNRLGSLFLVITFTWFLLPGRVFCQNPKQVDATWALMQKTGKGDLTIYWFENKPILYLENDKELKGIEFEIIHGFSKYVLDSFNVKLKLNWVKLNTFKDVYNQISGRAIGSYIGAARISILEERKKEVNFTPPYMSDISILLTSSDLPLAVTKEQLINSLSSSTAITMPGTSFENDIKDLATLNHIEFPIKYESKGTDILKSINKNKKSFGYVSLLSYLFNYNQTTNSSKRQNFYIKVANGLGLAYPKESSLQVPLNSYFNSIQFKSILDKSISNYIDLNLFKFIENLSVQSDLEVSLLSKEKELQDLEIQLKNEAIFQSGKERNILIGIIVFVLILFVIASFLLKKQLENHHLLREQKAEIDAQADETKAINENLATLVKGRTDDLEQKNKSLEESAFFTAHKLRAPVASILGLISLTENIESHSGTKDLLNEIKIQTREVDNILHSVISIIEKGDIKKPNPPL